MAYDKVVDSVVLDSALTGIADAIRSKTGGTDLLPFDQMAAAIAGIQVGGGDVPGGASGIYMAQVTPAGNVGSITIEHNLGTTDILLAALWAESLGDVAPTFNGCVANIYLKSAMPYRTNSSVNHENLIAHALWNTSLNNVNTVGQPASDVYYFKIVDENTIEFPSGGAAAAKHFGGVTYTVVIMAASAFAPTEV